MNDNKTIQQHVTAAIKTLVNNHLKSLDPYKELKEAWAAGKTIEYEMTHHCSNYIGCPKWMPFKTEPLFTQPIEYYRIKED